MLIEDSFNASLLKLFAELIKFCFRQKFGAMLIKHNGIQHNDTQHNDTQHNETEHNDTQHDS